MRRARDCGPIGQSVDYEIASHRDFGLPLSILSERNHPNLPFTTRARESKRGGLPLAVFRPDRLSNPCGAPAGVATFGDRLVGHRIFDAVEPPDIERGKSVSRFCATVGNDRVRFADDPEIDCSVCARCIEQTPKLPHHIEIDGTACFGRTEKHRLLTAALPSGLVWVGEGESIHAVKPPRIDPNRVCCAGLSGFEIEKAPAMSAPTTGIVPIRLGGFFPISTP